MPLKPYIVKLPPMPLVQYSKLQQYTKGSHNVIEYVHVHEGSVSSSSLYMHSLNQRFDNFGITYMQSMLTEHHKFFQGVSALAGTLKLTLYCSCVSAVFLHIQKYSLTV